MCGTVDYLAPELIETDALVNGSRGRGGQSRPSDTDTVSRQSVGSCVRSLAFSAVNLYHSPLSLLLSHRPPTQSLLRCVVCVLCAEQEGSSGIIEPPLGYDYSVDVWGLGVLAYELAVGGPPFHAHDRRETMRRIQTVSSRQRCGAQARLPCLPFLCRRRRTTLTRSVRTHSTSFKGGPQVIWAAERQSALLAPGC